MTEILTEIIITTIRWEKPTISSTGFSQKACRFTTFSGDTVSMATITYQGLEVLYTHQQIAEKVAEMGAQITHDLNEEKLVMIGVLKGAAIFLADLAR